MVARYKTEGIIFILNLIDLLNKIKASFAKVKKFINKGFIFYLLLNNKGIV